MKKIISFCFICMFVATSFAQKDSFDLVTYTPPNGWEKEVATNTTSYTITNKQNKSWCRIYIIKSTISKGSIDQDFESEWQELVVKNYTLTGEPQFDEVQEIDSWKMKSGLTKFIFNKSDAIAMLITWSGFDHCVSTIVTTNSEDYLITAANFISSI